MEIKGYPGYVAVYPPFAININDSEGRPLYTRECKVSLLVGDKYYPNFINVPNGSKYLIKVEKWLKAKGIKYEIGLAFPWGCRDEIKSDLPELVGVYTERKIFLKDMKTLEKRKCTHRFHASEAKSLWVAKRMMPLVKNEFPPEWVSIVLSTMNFVRGHVTFQS